MSFLTAAYLMQTYGPLLTEHELSAVLKLEPGTVRNKRAGGGSLASPTPTKGKPIYVQSRESCSAKRKKPRQALDLRYGTVTYERSKTETSP